MNHKQRQHACCVALFGQLAVLSLPDPVELKLMLQIPELVSAQAILTADIVDSWCFILSHAPKIVFLSVALESFTVHRVITKTKADTVGWFHTINEDLKGVQATAISSSIMSTESKITSSTILSSYLRLQQQPLNESCEAELRNLIAVPTQSYLLTKRTYAYCQGLGIQELDIEHCFFFPQFQVFTLEGWFTTYSPRDMLIRCKESRHAA